MRQMNVLLLASAFSFILACSPRTDMEKIRDEFLRMTEMDYSPDADVTENCIRYSDAGRANDVMLLGLYMGVHLPDHEVERLLGIYDWDSACWKDIDYAANKRGRWPPTFHVTRMYALAKLYKAGNRRWKGSEELKTLLHGCIATWCEKMPVCPNWWHNQIGVPKKFAAVLLMLADELSPEELENGLKVLEPAKFGMTGQNKMWLAGNNLMKGILIDDESLVQEACRQIQETICITDGEGIQHDWSFHQHGPQVQFGNYGLAFVDAVSFWMSVLKGTKFDFTQEQKDIIANFMKEGSSWCVYKGYLDPSHCGRQVFVNSGKGKASAFAMAARNMANAGIEKEFFTKVYNENMMPQQYPNTLCGEKYFWRSDCGIFRRSDWYASIRMHSERTVGFEFTNRENTLAYFSADGALLLMQDGEEFTDIYAYWDWRKLPGVTAYDDGQPLKSDNDREAKKNHSGHVGGLVHDGIMTTTMEINRDGLTALKSAFFFDDCIVNLGAGIKGSGKLFNSVTTGVEQIHLSMDGFQAGEKWAYHSDRGYLSLDGASMNVTGNVQKGKWDYIEPTFVDKWDEGKVFSCWFDHPMDMVEAGTAGYAYAVFPRTSLDEIRTIASMWDADGCTDDMRVLRNDEDCQAVAYKEHICAVFHVPGEYELEGKKIQVTSPQIFICTSKGESRTDIPARSAN